MKYKIGDVAKLLGITPEAIRFYEEQGIIAPEKSETSRYRLYDVWDIHMLIRARSYRQFGYSLAETAKMLNEYAINDYIVQLSLQERTIEETILWNINLLKRIRETQSIIKDANSFVGEYRIENRPAIYRIETQDAYTLRSGKKARESMKKWVDKVPFVYPCALFGQEGVCTDNETFTFGLGVDAEYADFLDIKDTEGVQYFPPISALYTTIRTVSDEVLTSSRLAAAMEYMRKQGLVLCDDVLSRVVLMRKENRCYASYHQLWFPFEIGIDREK